MDLTVDRLKIGAKLVLGKYGVQNEDPHPIVWLKASPNCDFITENAVDYLLFDARERSTENRAAQYYGNPQLSLSNIFSFLNSEDESWFHQTHEADAPPDTRNVDNRRRAYAAHYGFLYHFADYEIESLNYAMFEADGEQISSLIRLPLSEEIVGVDRFKLFTRRGVRPKGTDDMVYNRQYEGFDFNSYIDFWVGDRHDDRYMRFISRSGTIDRKVPREPCGLRPVCQVKPDVAVIPGDNDLFYVKQYAVSQNVCTEAELLNFLGLARP